MALLALTPTVTNAYELIFVKMRIDYVSDLPWQLEEEEEEGGNFMSSKAGNCK